MLRDVSALLGPESLRPSVSGGRRRDAGAIRQYNGRNFREVRRVLSDDGALWLNIGDGYARNGGTGVCGSECEGREHREADSKTQLQGVGLLEIERP